VIIGFNGQPVRQVEDLQWLVTQASPGDTAEIEVVRRDQTLVMPIRLVPLPATPPMTPPPDIVSLLLQRSELIWMVLGGAAIALMVVYLALVVPRRQRRQPRPGAGFPSTLPRRLPHRKLIFGCLGFLALLTFWSSLTVIPVGYRGVVFHLIRGIQPETLGEGIHFRPPVLHRITAYDVRSHVYQVRSRPEPLRRGLSQPQDHMLWTPTADGLKVGLDLSVRYRLDPMRLPELHRNVGPEFVEKVVHPVAWNVTRLVASEYSLLDVYGKRRHEIQQQAFDRARALLARDGLICEALLLQDVTYTKEFEKTLVAKMIAEQKVRESAYEVEQAELRAQAQVIEAHGEAQALAIVNDAIHSHPLLLQYLWIKSLPEKVKIMVVPNRTGGSTPAPKPPSQQ
jgi:regulator of protease activity HflC (stomatin/prohibitin superfamily)